MWVGGGPLGYLPTVPFGFLPFYPLPPKGGLVWGFFRGIFGFIYREVFFWFWDYFIPLPLKGVFLDFLVYLLGIVFSCFPGPSLMMECIKPEGLSGSLG